MSFQDLILQYLTVYQMPAVFTGAFFFGETVILTAAVLVFRFHWPLIGIFTAAFLGTIVSDILWYTLGRHALHFSWAKGTSLYEKYEKRFKSLERIMPFEKPFLVLLYIKFLYGTRILTLLYLSMHRIRISTFMIFEIIGTIIWLAALFLVAFLSVAGVYNVIPRVHEFALFLTAVFLGLLAIKAISLWITKKAEEK